MNLDTWRSSTTINSADMKETWRRPSPVQQESKLTGKKIITKITSRTFVFVGTDFRERSVSSYFGGRIGLI